MRSRFIPVCFLLFAGLAHSFGQETKRECLTISVSGPAGIVQPGDKFVFTGAVEGKVPQKISYHWQVSDGKITAGQGTLKISAELPPGKVTLTATLEVVGLPEGCPRSVSETGSILVEPHPVLVAEFGKLPTVAMRSRLDKFFSELHNHPTNQGYIILYGTDKEMAARERLVISSINVRRFPTERTTIVRGGIHPDGTVYTKLHRIPPGADNPAP